jgi:ABC-type Fe3+-hydroxamate transport system substrate-binding protein
MPFLLPAVRALPELGRLTGRGDTLNLERLLAGRPDVIIDFGSVSATYRSLADRVQAQTGIPYVLIDGRFARPGADVGQSHQAVRSPTRCRKDTVWKKRGEPEHPELVTLAEALA